MRRSASLGETEQNCTIWVATSYTCLLRSRTQVTEREVVVPALLTERLTEPRVDVDAWGHLGLPRMRLDFTVVDAKALHHSSAMRKAQDTAQAAAQAEKTKENKYGKTKGGVGDTGIAMQLSGRFGPGLDALLRRLAGYKRAITKAAGRDGGRSPTEVAKTPEPCARQIRRCDNPVGHRAQGLERSVERVALSVFLLPFGIEPLLVNAASKT